MKIFGSFMAFLSLFMLTSVLLSTNDTMDTFENTREEPEIIDLCNGQSEFLSIPAGADIIFTASIYSHSPYSPSELYAMDIDELKIYRITCSNYTEPKCDYSRADVSQDRQKIVVMRGCDDTNGDGLINFLDGKSMCVVNLSNDTIFEISGLVYFNSPGWSIKNRIVFAAGQEGSLDTDIYVMDEDGGNLQNLTDTDDYLENDPCWSSDGEQIVFFKGQFVTPEGLPDGSFLAATGDLWVMDSIGSSQRKVVSFGGDSNCPNYSDNFCQGLLADPDFFPEGDRIVFEKLISTSENNGSGRWNIFSASLDGLDQDIINLTNNLTAYQSIPRTSRRGIVFHEVDISIPFNGLVNIDLSGENREILLDNSTWEYYLGPASWLWQKSIRSRR